jgi:hypothetical protein
MVDLWALQMVIGMGKASKGSRTDCHLDEQWEKEW